MTDNPCNCSTCTKTFEECGLQKNKNPTDGHWYVGEMLRPAFKYTGCLSHPRAREWLMKDEIEELIRRTNSDIHNITIKEAIALIKEGGDKK